MKARIGPLVAYVISCVCFTGSNAEYLGKFIGKLSELHHGVSGEVYAVDGRTLHIKDFTYDGQGPAAYFYAGNTRVAGSSGFRLRDENGKGDVIRRYRKEGVTLTLPEGKTLNNIKIFYVWCEEFAVNFGDVKIPRNFDYPKPQKIDALNGVHGISSDNIVIVDAQTLLIPNLSYDGEAPDAKFWVGRGPKPSPQGIRVPDENGKEVPLRRYDRKTVVLTLPGDLTVFDIGHFGIWCEAFTVDFGHIQIPQDLNVPPSLKMLGVSPQKRPRLFGDNSRQGGVSRPRFIIGGHLDATTFRPPTRNVFSNRRTDAAAHEVVHRDIYSNPQQNTLSQQRPKQQTFQQAQPFQQPQVFQQTVAFQQTQPFQQRELFHHQREPFHHQREPFQQTQPFQQKQSFQTQRFQQPRAFFQQPQQQQSRFQQNREQQRGFQQQFFNQQPGGNNGGNLFNLGNQHSGLISRVGQSRPPVPYAPLNGQDQQAYSQLQQKRLQEETQIQNQFNRPQGRFNLGANNENSYVPFG